MQITQQARDIAVEACRTTGFGPVHLKKLRAGESDGCEEVIAAQMALDTITRSPMTEDEILRRARRTVEQNNGNTAVNGSIIFTGTLFDCVARIVAQALRDLDKPLVDPVVLACREILASEATDYVASLIRAGDRDDSKHMLTVIAAYHAGMQHNG